MGIVKNKLTASEGMTLTNGSAFGKRIYLAEADAPILWREISDAEAEIMRQDLEEAAAENYEAALAEMGVAV